MGDGWLETQDLPRSQYRSPRREPLRGIVELHTAESIYDKIGPDTGAENVAHFIATRDTPGSYHDLVDSDSIMHLVDYDDEAYHDATGLNPSTTSVSAACSTTDWAKMSSEKREGFLRNMAKAAANQARHQKIRTGKIVRAVRLSKQQVLNGETGFLYHGDSDPTRRSDPGTTPPALFPWDEFIRYYRHYAADVLGTSSPDPGGFLMALNDKEQADLLKMQAETWLRMIAVLDLVEDLHEEMVGVIDSAGRSRQDRLVLIEQELLALARAEAERDAAEG